MKQIKIYSAQKKRHMNIYRNNILSFLFLFMLILNNACESSSHDVREGEIKTGSKKIVGSYDYFTGCYLKTIYMKKDQILEPEFTLITQQGELKVRLLGPDGEELLEILDKEEIDNIYHARKKGKYKLQVTGKEHKGSFLLEWEVKN